MDENELKIISEISKNSSASQRELSKISKLSLGMVNIILHRLIEKGYMKIKQLDGRRVNYILTPKGFTEKLDKSRQYLSRTMFAVSVLKDVIKEKFETCYLEGGRRFVSLADQDIAPIIGLAAKEVNKHDLVYREVTSPDLIDADEIVFYAKQASLDSLPGNKILDLTKELAEAII